jgi:hypothetical protein
MGASLDVSDPETQGLIAKWVSAIASGGLVALGLQRWMAKRRAAADAKFAAKADLREIEDLHERIKRHKEANDEQITKNYRAVIDLYEKHEHTQQELLRAEQRSSDRFEKLMTAIGAIRQ